MSSATSRMLCATASSRVWSDGTIRRTCQHGDSTNPTSRPATISSSCPTEPRKFAEEPENVMPTLQPLDLPNGFRNAMRRPTTTEWSVGRVNHRLAESEQSWSVK
jgi:hypothetical protein